MDKDLYYHIIDLQARIDSVQDRITMQQRRSIICYLLITLFIIFWRT